MSKSSVFENKAFQKTSSGGVGFNLAPRVNSFNSIFETKPLDETESNRIERLLVDSYVAGSIDEEQVERDLNQLKLITSEIRAIGRQGTVLMGERVHKAKEVLKPYKDGTFTRWLESTFGTRKTGYNVLSYFELYRDLPQVDLKEKFKKMPLRAAYVLASREVDLDSKASIIRDCHELNHSELVAIIQDRLPASHESNRAQKSFVERLIVQIRDNAKKLEKRKDVLNDVNRIALEEAKQLIDSLLS
jgi:hypothetical protein